MPVGVPELPWLLEPQDTKLPSAFCPTNAAALEKTWVKPVPVGALPVPPKLELPQDLTVLSFLTAVNAWRLE